MHSFSVFWCKASLLYSREPRGCSPESNKLFFWAELLCAFAFSPAAWQEDETAAEILYFSTVSHPGWEYSAVLLSLLP